MSGWIMMLYHWGGFFVFTKNHQPGLLVEDSVFATSSSVK